MSIRGTVLTLNEINNNESIQTKTKKRINYFSNKRNKKLNLDLVYVIYTTDKWKTWKFMNTLQKSCKINDSNKLIRTHEFFIQNIINNNTNDNDENIFQLQLIVCYQIDSHVYQDDNQKLIQGGRSRDQSNFMQVLRKDLREKRIKIHLN